MADLPSDAWIAYTDGSAAPNPGPCGMGVTVTGWVDGTAVVVEASVPLGMGTNNIGELWGIGGALQVGLVLSQDGQLGRNQVYAIATDSRFALKTVGAMQRSGDLRWLVAPIRRLVRRLSRRCILRFLWVPGHVGLQGNERADALADRASAASKAGASIDLGARAADGHFLCPGSPPIYPQCVPPSVPP